MWNTLLTRARRAFTSSLGLAALAASFSCGISTAQRVWLVDQAGGSHIDFTDLPSALAAASPLDTIVVGPGTYATATTNKPLRILAFGASTLTGGPADFLSQLPAGQDFVLAGFILAGDFRFSNCASRIHLHSICSTASAPLRIDVADCQHLSIAQSDLRGGRVTALRSGVVVGGSSIIGADATPMQVAEPGLLLNQSRGLITASSVTGGNGLAAAVAAPAIRQNQSSLEVGGDGQAKLVAGVGGPTPAPCVDTVGGSIILDPSIQLLSTNGVVVTGSGQLTTQPMPALTASTAAPGTPLDLQLYGGPGDFVALVAGVPLDVTPLAPFGDLWIHPAAVVLLANAFVDSSGYWQYQIAVPASVPPGSVLNFQALTGPLNQSIVLSNPAVVTIY